VTVALYPFLLLAAAGFLLSAAAHCMALAGVPIPGGTLIWRLGFGIFIVWIPTVLVASQAARYGNRKDFWKISLSGCPPWMRASLYVVFGYAILNFLLYLWSHPQKQSIAVATPSAIRGFSGHWMLFYGAAFAILYSRIRAPQLYQPRTCPQGHVASPNARFCPECGYAFPDAAAREPDRGS
jgi:hypothetical protein